MLTFNGIPLLALHDFAQTEAPELHAQRTHFAGIDGESAIILGVGGRQIAIEVWLTDASFHTAADVDAYRQTCDLSVGVTADLSITDSQGNRLGFYQDVTFEGYFARGKILPAIGGGLPAGTYWQAGQFRFQQNSTP